MGSVWNEAQNFGNPAASIKVRKYVKAVKQEQAISRVKVSQAKPLFFDKLKMIFVHIDSLLLGNDQNVGERFALLRDQAFFKLRFSGETGLVTLEMCCTGY